VRRVIMQVAPGTTKRGGVMRGRGSRNRARSCRYDFNALLRGVWRIRPTPMANANLGGVVHPTIYATKGKGKVVQAWEVESKWGTGAKRMQGFGWVTRAF
jgi:hypothetical protein